MLAMLLQADNRKDSADTRCRCRPMSRARTITLIVLAALCLPLVSGLLLSAKAQNKTPVACLLSSPRATPAICSQAKVKKTTVLVHKRLKQCARMKAKKRRQACRATALRKLKQARKCAAVKIPKKTPKTTTTPAASPPPYGYSPAQIQHAYSLPSTAPAPQTIAIVSAYDDPTAEQDLGVYSTAYGLPACTSANGCFTKVNGQGQPSPLPAPDSLWALESSLDVQAVHAICNNCKIILVETSSDGVPGLAAGDDMAVTLGANIVSNSWVANEFSSETSLDSHFNHPGVAITAATGDTGGHVVWPAASPYVTAVGGTTLDLDSTGTRTDEAAWGSSGSGCSLYETKPAWQTDTGCARRTIPDVSIDGDPDTGIAIYDSHGYSGRSGWFVVAGTSLGAPLIAGIYALAGNASSVIAGSYPYSHTSSLFDIVTGSNGSCGTYLCNAGVGYDGPTGLGTPNGVSGF